ncbi:MAG TPA: hypothetical protein VL179_04660, partial [Mycobacterium sp.]|nr:hypothetical protein [Mycobacterium sp.]
MTGPVAVTVATPLVDRGQSGPTYVGGFMAAFVIDTVTRTFVRVEAGVGVCATGVVAVVGVSGGGAVESGSGEIAGSKPGDRTAPPLSPRPPKARKPTPMSTPIATTAADTISAMGRCGGTAANSTVSSGCGGN